jgi:hypothetical protein
LNPPLQQRFVAGSFARSRAREVQARG